MDFVTGRRLTEAVQRILAHESRDMAVAFWGHGACNRLALPIDAKGSRVICDARSGGCNPTALAELLTRNVAIQDVPGLHAKVYIGSNGVVVTSANASTNGLGEEGDDFLDDLEAGYVSERQEDIRKARQWFDATWVRGRPVTKDELPELQDLWLDRQKHRPLRSESFLEVLRTRPDRLRGRSLKVAIYDYVDVPAEVERAYKASGFYDPRRYEHLPGYPFFFDVDEWNVVSGDLILNFECVDGDVYCEGTWWVLAVIEDGKLVPLQHVKRPFLLKLPESDRRKLARQVKSLIRRNILRVNGPLIPIEDFASALAL
jgi:hypothetical protein